MTPSEPASSLRIPLFKDVVLTVLGHVGARLVTSLAAVFYIPMLISALGREGFGVYSVLVSLSAFGMFVDAGVGAGIRSRVAERDQHRHALAVTVAAGLAVLLLLGAAVSVVLATAFFIVPWRSITGAGSGLSNGTLDAAVAWSLAAFALGIPLLLVPRALEGLGLSRRVARASAAPGLVIGAAVLLRHVFDDSFVVLTAVSNMAAVVPPLLLLFAVARRRLPRPPSLRSPEVRREMRSVWELSWPMMIISVALSLSYSLDVVVISSRLGAEPAGRYAIASRVVQIANALVYASAPVLWTHFVRLRANSPDRTQAATWRLSALFAAASSAVGAVLVALGPGVTSLWSSGRLTAPRSLFAAFAIWGIVLGYQLPLAMAQNDRFGLLFQVRSTTLMAALNVALSLALVEPLGVSGPVWASAITLFACHALPLSVRLRRLRPRAPEGE